MKKVIEGKVYNTETATKICAHDYGAPSDFSYISEALYKTKKGAFFIAGEGGANTDYRVAYGQNEWGGGEALRAIGEPEAREFCERHGDAEDYARAFGEPEEG